MLHRISLIQKVKTAYHPRRALLAHGHRRRRVRPVFLRAADAAPSGVFHRGGPCAAAPAAGRAVQGQGPAAGKAARRAAEQEALRLRQRLPRRAHGAADPLGGHPCLAAGVCEHDQLPAPGVVHRQRPLLCCGHVRHLVRHFLQSCQALGEGPSARYFSLLSFADS